MRKVGQILIGLAIAAAVVGGLALSSQVSRADGDLAAVAPLAAVLLVVVTAIAAAGVYVYVKSEPAESASSETELQRKLADALGSGDRLSFQALANVLGTDPQAVARLLSELARLEVLPAAVSWDSAIIYPRNRGYLASQTTCLHCESPLSPPQGRAATCAVCRTVHYDV